MHLDVNDGFKFKVTNLNVLQPSPSVVIALFCSFQAWIDTHHDFLMQRFDDRFSGPFGMFSLINHVDLKNDIELIFYALSCDERGQSIFEFQIEQQLEFSVPRITKRAL